MAPRMAASVFWCAFFCLIFFINPVFCFGFRSSFTREELINIRETTPVDFFPTFLDSSVGLLDILVRGALTVALAVKRRRRGKRAGALARLRRRALRTPLPGIFLSNVRSLPNKLDELQLLVQKNRDFSSSSVLCFTETWLCGSIPNSALELAGFQLFRADRDTELSGKTKVGGICFYANSGWCKDVTVILQHCSPDLETFIINCRPFYSPREFTSIILVGVYIPPQANVQEAQRALADQILCVERTNPDSVVIVLGDFNKGDLSHELPKYRQFVNCPTREGNTLDHCYTTISGAYHAVPRAALGHSDHVMVHLIPCTSSHQSVKLLKFADDTTLIGLISDGDESAYRWETDRLVTWCRQNNLELNALKTVEMIVDFRKSPAPPTPITLCDSPVATVEHFRFLGTTITQDLKWELNISSLIKKAQQRMYFLRQLKKFNLPRTMMVNFYTSIIESILTSSITIWYAAATERDNNRLQRIIHSAEKVIGCNLPSLQDLYASRTLRRAGKIVADSSHPGHKLFETLPSGRRLRSFRTKTSRHKNSFFPSAISLINKAREPHCC
ncbi:uncharacterized protein [Trachinotus anak]|uniref:uncharacterized protein n=1 Tax=Trachinotus anak TaxID=443729 RepID=UPI0039F1F758